MSEELVAQVRSALQHQVVQTILGNDQVARQHGLRVTDLQTLHLMVLQPEVRTPRQISDATGIPTSTVTKLVDRLEAAGYLRRVPDANDRRKTLLQLIPEAIEPLATRYGTSDDQVDRVSRQFTDDELRTVLRYLQAVCQAPGLVEAGLSGVQGFEGGF